VPLLIVIKLEQFDYAGATLIATLMLVASFVLLFAINLLQAWTGGDRVVDLAPAAGLAAHRGVPRTASRSR